MTDRTYCYPPDFSVLRNKLGLRDEAALDQAERLLVTQRIYKPDESIALLKSRKRA